MGHRKSVLRSGSLPMIALLSLLALQTAAQAADQTNDNTSAATSDSTTQSSASNTDSTSSLADATTTLAQDSTNTVSTGTPFPTISGVLPPPLIVPDTSDAPFMQKSNLPEGTVFICVGAALGLLGACVLAWRGLVAWSLHRSVKRAAETTYAPDNKSMFGLAGLASTSQGYKSMYSNNDSVLSLDHLSSAPTGYGGPSHGRNNSPSPAGHRGSTHNLSATNKRTSRLPPHGNRSSRAPPPDRSSLFFSPTAQNTLPASTTTATSAHQHTPGNRSSAHLPAGYYASSASAPASGNAVAQLGGHGHERSTPHSRDGSSTNFTPPDSPLTRPGSSHLLRPDSPSGNSMTASVGRPSSTHMQARSQSRDRLSAVRPEQRRSRLGPDGGGSSGVVPREGATGREGDRTPSAYFEDLLENHGFGPGERFQ